MTTEILKNPNTYPHSTNNIEHISTATSDVFLTGEFAYKTCKPIDIGFINLTTLEKRKNHVLKELSHNSKMSPEIYIEIVKLIKNSDSNFSVVNLNYPDSAIEYAIKMKQLNPRSIGNEIIKERKLSYSEVINLVQEIANYHNIADSSDEISKYGSTESIKFNWDENFEQTLHCKDKLISIFDFDLIKFKVNNFIELNKDLFNKRILDNKIKHCHGDFHLENVFFIDNKAILFDGISFNMRFPCSDVASEIAFMAMDMESKNQFNESKLFTSNYQHLTSDFEMSKLLNFYKSYRAYIRAKIAFFGSEDEKAKKYFALSREYATLL